MYMVVTATKNSWGPYAHISMHCLQLTETRTLHTAGAFYSLHKHTTLPSSKILIRAKTDKFPDRDGTLTGKEVSDGTGYARRLAMSADMQGG